MIKLFPTAKPTVRRGNLDYYFIRPEVDNKLKEEFDSTNKTIIVTGQSTSGKTIAVCRMLKKLPQEYYVVILNADTTKEQLERLSVSQFQHGKKILLLDDLQLLFWKEENESRYPLTENYFASYRKSFTSAIRTSRLLPLQAIASRK